MRMEATTLVRVKLEEGWRAAVETPFTQSSIPSLYNYNGTLTITADRADTDPKQVSPVA